MQGGCHVSMAESCARGGRRFSILKLAVTRVAEELRLPIIERMEERYLLDSCDYGTGNTITWNGTSANDNVTMEISSGQLLVKNGGTTICSNTSGSVIGVTLFGGDGDHTLSGAGSPVAVLIRADAGRDLLIGSDHIDDL